MYCVYSIYTWVYGHVVTIEAYLWGLQSLTTSEWKPYMQQHGPVSSTNIATLQHKTNNCPHTLIKGVQASFLNSTLIKFSHNNALSKQNKPHLTAKWHRGVSKNQCCTKDNKAGRQTSNTIAISSTCHLSNVHLFLSSILPCLFGFNSSPYLTAGFNSSPYLTAGFNSSPYLTANYHTLCDLLEVRLTCSH